MLAMVIFLSLVLCSGAIQDDEEVSGPQHNDSPTTECVLTVKHGVGDGTTRGVYLPLEGAVGVAVVADGRDLFPQELVVVSGLYITTVVLVEVVQPVVEIHL